jgi:hypothetical protein
MALAKKSGGKKMVDPGAPGFAFSRRFFCPTFFCHAFPFTE